MFQEFCIIKQIAFHFLQIAVDVYLSINCLLVVFANAKWLNIFSKLLLKLNLLLIENSTFRHLMTKKWSKVLTTTLLYHDDCLMKRRSLNINKTQPVGRGDWNFSLILSMTSRNYNEAWVPADMLAGKTTKKKEEEEKNKKNKQK